MNHLRVRAALLAAALCAACAGAHRAGSTAEELSDAAIPPGEPQPVEDALHGVQFELPPAKGGWQEAHEGAARVGDGVQVEVATFPLARAASAPACRDTARTRLTQARKPDPDTEAAPADPVLEGPREQSVGDAPTAVWSFTRGTAGAAVRSRWGFYARGSDCVLLEVTGASGDKFAAGVFALAARSFKVGLLPPDRQREVDLLAGMRFLEQHEPASALDRFEALAAREPDFAKAHFGALIAGFEVGAQAYARALPHGEAALKSERDLSPEQRQTALRAVGVMQLAQDHVRNAAETLAELVVRAPDFDEGQYNYACALARLGDVPGALDHLGTALRLNQSLIPHAREDDDLKSLRGNAVFEELTREPRTGTDPHTEAAPPPSLGKDK